MGKIMSKTKTVWKNLNDEWEDINLGDVFLIYGGRNQHGLGHQIATVNKITKHDNIYCEKYSIRKKHCIGLKCKLDRDMIIKKLKV